VLSTVAPTDRATNLGDVCAHATITHMHETELPRDVKIRLWGAILATVAVVALNMLLALT
jgi:hypothetical protein